jgi:hypothetical protein
MYLNIDSHIVFPPGERKVQSPYLYLQSAGSTGADGSTYGAHVRWLLLRNLDEHLPKGDAAATSLGFNRGADYVTLLRSRYEKRFPSVVDFSVPPFLANDSSAFWIYKTAATNLIVYLHFRDAARYAAVRATLDPAQQPLAFLESYCPALLEAEVKDHLVFAASFDVRRDAATVLRAEALSVESNVPLSPLFVSCRTTFTRENWCPPVAGTDAVPLPEPQAAIFTSGSPAGVPPCGGPNLLRNGGFESEPLPATFGFETDYALQGGTNQNTINVVSDARSINPAWTGTPHSGKQFLAVDGAYVETHAVLRIRLVVQPQTDYSFAGWLATLWPQDVSIPLHFRITVPGGAVQSFRQETPDRVGVWEPFSFIWSSGTATAAVVEIFSLSVKTTGNDFGLDDLQFCAIKGRPEPECLARLVSENIRAVRFEVTGGAPRRIELETYDDYIAGASWETLDHLALATDDAAVFNRLEPAAGAVNGHWLKFQPPAALNVSNYHDRWTRTGGLREGVQRYITLSNTDPRAIATLPGAQQQDGSLEISLLDALRMVSLDFHVARMLGLGLLDRNIAGDTDSYIYLAIYDTEGALDDTYVARPVRHYFMGVPTRPLDFRLPDPPVLQPVTYGLTVDNGEPQPSLLTDSQGYTPDGLARYINLFVEPEAESPALGPFFVPPDPFCAIDKTSGVFYGVRYRGQGEPAWRVPEIAHDLFYKDSGGTFETLPLPNNANPARPILRHEERENGVHEYGGYEINWFSRASSPGNIVATDATAIAKAVRLLPPSNFAVQFIQPESPPMLTTPAEQAALALLTGPDPTLVRVTFDYFHAHDVNYQFADVVELFFRTELPRNVVGAIASVTEGPPGDGTAILRTADYVVNSQGSVIQPLLAPGLFANFAGGVLSCQEQNYIIDAVSASSIAGEGPVFTIRKNVEGSPSDPGGTGAFVTVQKSIVPDLSAANGQVMFMAVENMADVHSWETSNPLAKTVTIGDGSWTAHTETYVQDGTTTTLQLRGLLRTANVTPEVSAGVYRIDFQPFLLPHHPQGGDADPVDWYKGAVRIARANDPAGPKRVLEVLLTEHIGDGQPLVLHVIDNEHAPLDPILTGPSVAVSYYPGYRVYLHADAAHDFTKAEILPAAGEGSRKSWLGARSRDTVHGHASPVGIPAPVVALEVVPALAPGEPSGSEFATWPDAYYKSSYTFAIDFTHQPFSVAMYRANDEALLRALYDDTTYDAVRAQLELLGDDDPDRSGRWRSLFDFGALAPGATFAAFPPGGYAFPNPDRGGALNGSPPGSVLDAVKEAVWGSFIALTEMPLIYDFIKGPSSIPAARPPTIRNAQGTLLDPADPEFDPSPMAKRTGNGFEIQFTDFTLDGTGNNLFFYCGREIGNRGKMSDPGRIAGPVQLINTRPAEPPAVRTMHVQEPDALTGSGPAVAFEINAYPGVQNVRRLLVYRATDPADALTVRTMEVVKTVDLDALNQPDGRRVLLSDDFESGFVPYGDPLFYRLVALRQVKRPDGGTNWVPSQASKVLLTTMIDTINPDPPQISFVSAGLSGTPAVLSGVALTWSPTAYNGSYYLDKMGATGNWRTIHRIRTNLATTVDLAATELGTNVLPKEDPDDGRPIYHRFRVRAENSSGLFSLTENVLTL